VALPACCWLLRNHLVSRAAASRRSTLGDPLRVWRRRTLRLLACCLSTLQLDVTCCVDGRAIRIASHGQELPAQSNEPSLAARRRACGARNGTRHTAHVARPRRTRHDPPSASPVSPPTPPPQWPPRRAVSRVRLGLSVVCWLALRRVRGRYILAHPATRAATRFRYPRPWSSVSMPRRTVPVASACDRPGPSGMLPRDDPETPLLRRGPGSAAVVPVRPPRQSSRATATVDPVPRRSELLVCAIDGPRQFRHA